MIKKPTVSVQMLTYNHEKFIRQAIESILKQKTNFYYNLIIADDCSIDETYCIIKDIINNHPKGHLIKYLRQDTNIGMQRNWFCSLSKCNGKYIATCEGDDYWIDPYKLQKQVDFLEKHPECVISYTRAKKVDEKGKDKGIIIPLKKNIKLFSNFEDQLKGNLIPSLTCVYRAGYLKKIPNFFYNHWCGDWIIHLLNSQYGKIGFLNEITAAYRDHSEGISKKIKKTKKIKQTINTYKSLNKYLNFRYNKIIKKMISKQYAILSKNYALDHKKKNSIDYLIKSCKYEPINKYAIFLQFKVIIALLFPKIFKLIRKKLL